MTWYLWWGRTRRSMRKRRAVSVVHARTLRTQRISRRPRRPIPQPDFGRRVPASAKGTGHLLDGKCLQLWGSLLISYRDARRRPAKLGPMGVKVGRPRARGSVHSPASAFSASVTGIISVIGSRGDGRNPYR